jgi:hypothetical protein
MPVGGNQPSTGTVIRVIEVILAFRICICAVYVGLRIFAASCTRTPEAPADAPLRPGGLRLETAPKPFFGAL